MQVRTFIFPALALLMVLGAVFSLPQAASALDCASTPEAKQKCEADYDKLQQEIAGWQKILDTTRAQKSSLTGDVTALNAQIKKAEAEIKAKNIAISGLGKQIAEKTTYISSLEARIGRGKDSLASLIRRQNQIDGITLPEIALGTEQVSDLFKDVDQMAAIEEGLKATFAQIRGDKAETETQRSQLTNKQGAEQDAKYVVQTKEKQISQDKQQKTQLLAITTNQETQYSTVLADRQAKASAIRSALFPLRDAAAIQFGDALKYAQAAEKATGVDAALVLAILTQESNLGANVGQCYMTDDATGNGVGKNTGTPFSGVMSPTRDVPPFIALSTKLGFDPHHQVVSCPIASVGGWGGAMGPAQFIPSTWALYASRIATDRGIPVANPWDPQDAIMAMSLLLSDNGASAGGYTANFNAAARYYAGWAGPSSAAGRSYGTQVMAKVAALQTNIDFLKDN